MKPVAINGKEIWCTKFYNSMELILRILHILQLKPPVSYQVIAIEKQEAYHVNKMWVL